MQSVVFKQRYKSVSNSSTPILNQKHLEYIATRKGVIKNPECGFGLWGKLPGQYEVQNIENLSSTKKLIGKTSKQHTLYRVVLSVDDDTAKAKDLYSRKTWEHLLKNRISCIAKEMNIQPKNFYWCASMHYKKGHPHVHILYWDNGTDPRPEYIPPEYFERISENIRAGFNRGIFESEIQDEQKKQNTIKQSLRFDLSQWLTEANPYDALNLDRLSEKRIDELTEQLIDLVRFAPATGSLKYQCLSKKFKMKIDCFVEQIFSIPQFSVQKNAYLKATEEISRLYGNGETTVQQSLEKAMKKVHKELANETLKSISKCLSQMNAMFQSETENLIQSELTNQISKRTLKILNFDPEYEKLLKQMPLFRSPYRAWDQETQNQFSLVVDRIWSDVRISKLRSSFLKQHSLDDEQRSELFKEIGTSIRHAVYEFAVEEKGYNQQLVSGQILQLLITSSKLLSQTKNQVVSHANQLKSKNQNLSQEQRRERKAKYSQAGDWQQGD